MMVTADEVKNAVLKDGRSEIQFSDFITITVTNGDLYWTPPRAKKKDQMTWKYLAWMINEEPIEQRKALMERCGFTFPEPKPKPKPEAEEKSES